MDNSYLNEAKDLFERAEDEANPARKLAALEEAFDLIDSVINDSNTSPSNQKLAQNMRHSNIRRLVSQLVEMRAIEFGDWFNYIRLLLLQQEVKNVLDKEPSLNASYQAFVAIWKDELVEALKNV